MPHYPKGQIGPEKTCYYAEYKTSLHAAAPWLTFAKICINLKRDGDDITGIEHWHVDTAALGNLGQAQQMRIGWHRRGQEEPSSTVEQVTPEDVYWSDQQESPAYPDGGFTFEGAYHIDPHGRVGTLALNIQTRRPSSGAGALIAGTKWYNPDLARRNITITNCPDDEVILKRTSSTRYEGHCCTAVAGPS